jgi:hypothetical protein
MPRALFAAWVLALVLAMIAFGSSAQAQTPKPQSIHILEIDSDDADDQAEGLTLALRSRARSAPGWILLDTTQSLSMMTAALRCPQRPDPACLQRIADLLKTDRFIWGVMTKQGAGPHQVAAELHMWARGKPDVVVRETYSDNLKDQGDDNLRKIASRSFDRLTGGPSTNVTVHAGTADGTVTIDGDQTFPLQHGVATFLLVAGAHTIEVKASGFVTARQNVVASGLATQDVNVDLAVEPPPPPPKTPTSSRKIVIWGTLVTGGALLVAGGVLAIVFEAERATLNNDRANNYNAGTPTGMQMPIQNPCIPIAMQPNYVPKTTSETTFLSQACSARDTAQSVLVPQIVTLAAGGVLSTVGIVLLATNHKKPPPDTVAAPPTGLSGIRIVPSVGPAGASIGLSASF